jgi:integrase
MRIPIKALCEGKRLKSDGTAWIYLQYFHDGVHRVFLNTELAIPPMHWDKQCQYIKESLPSEFGNHETLNDEINRQLRLASDLILLAKKQGIGNLGAFVKDKYSPQLNLDQLAMDVFQLHTAYSPDARKSKEGFFKQLDDYIRSKERKVKPATLQVFRSMQQHLEAFEKHRKEPITFASLDFQFYEGLVDFLTFEYELPRKKKPQYGLRVNTIGKTIHQFRIFIKDRVRRKIIPAIDLTDFKVPNEETDAIYLDYDEIGQIYAVDLTEYPDLIPARNLFVLGCLTGLRFSDYSALKPEDLRNGNLYKKQEKSVHWVVIPLRPEAAEIFTDDFKKTIPEICNVAFNKKIKLIAQLAGLTQTIKFSYRKGNKNIEIKRPKCAWVTSHTARRSFCTNEYMAGTPVKMIMQISGHKREKDFYKYVRIDPEVAAQKIKELWIQRGGLKAFKNLRK